jgi:hypothetical protein
MDPDDRELVLLEQALEHDPLEDETWRVYADLLESQDDPTAGLIRQGLQTEGAAWAPPLKAPFVSLPEVEVRWRPRRLHQARSVDPFAPRGLSVAVRVDLQQESALTHFMLTQLERQPRIWVFLQDLWLCHVPQRTWMTALARLPLKRLVLKGSIQWYMGSLEQFPHLLHLCVPAMTFDHELSRDLALRTLVFQAGRDLGFLDRLPQLGWLGLRMGRVRPELAPLRGRRLDTLSVDFPLETKDWEVLASMSLRRLELLRFRGAVPGDLERLQQACPDLQVVYSPG